MDGITTAGALLSSLRAPLAAAVADTTPEVCVEACALVVTLCSGHIPARAVSPVAEGVLVPALRHVSFSAPAVAVACHQACLSVLKAGPAVRLATVLLDAARDRRRAAQRRQAFEYIRYLIACRAPRELERVARDLEQTITTALVDAEDCTAVGPALPAAFGAFAAAWPSAGALVLRTCPQATRRALAGVVDDSMLTQPATPEPEPHT